MIVTSVPVVRVALMGWVVAMSVLVGAGTGAGLTVGGTSPRISIAVSNGFLSVNYTTSGFPISLEVLVVANDATAFEADVYVGMVAPNGEATSLLVNPPATGFTPTIFPVLMTGPPEPFLKNGTLTRDTGGRFEISSFAAGGPHGWYMIYALVVPTGQDPGNPKNWVTSSFSPLLVTTPGSP